MIAEWSYFKAHFTPQQCDKIISTALELPEIDGKLGPSTDRVDNEWRRSKIRSIPRTESWIWLYREIDLLVAEANNRWFNVDYKFLPGIQFASYSDKDLGCYKRHQDTFLAPLPTHRKLSFTIQLSDPSTYEGGELNFLDVCSLPNKENIRLQGTVCVFPSIVFHEVTPVTKGIRHSLAGWYEGPHWR
jgi:PKHD-type hydroxylase